MILYDDFLKICKLISQNRSDGSISREMNISVSTIYRIRNGTHYFCQPPPLSTNDRFILPYPNHPELPPLITKLRHCIQKNLPISSDDLTKARQFGLINSDGELLLPPNLPQNGSGEALSKDDPRHQPPPKRLLESNPGPTIEDYASPDYIDSLLDQEVARIKESQTNPSPTPDPPVPKGYGRCPSCGGLVYLPCWKCYIDSLCGPVPS